MPWEEYDHLLDLVKKRRTVRKFKPDPLPEGCIERIIEVARWSPSGFHTQPWEFVVVQKREMKEAIIKALDKHAPPIINTGSGEETFPRGELSRCAGVYHCSYGLEGKSGIARPSH